MRGARLRASGFTLIELMVVLALVSIVLAIGIPSTLKFVRVSQVAGARNTLMADLGYARSLATERRKTYQIVFTAGSYTIAQVTPALNIITRAMPAGIICAASATATFYPWGLSDPIAVTVRSPADTTTVSVSVNGSMSHD